jgi:hypothetical protein
MHGYRGGRGSGGGAARGGGELDGRAGELVVVVVVVAPAPAVPAAAHDPREALRGGARRAVMRAGADGPGASPGGGGGPYAAERPGARVEVDRGRVLGGPAGRRLRAAAAGWARRPRVEAPPRRVPQPAAAWARRTRQAIHLRGLVGEMR